MESRAWAIIITAGCVALAVIVREALHAMVRLAQAKLQAQQSGVSLQLERLESAVEAVAIEVERVGERQRFEASTRADVASALDEHRVPVAARTDIDARRLRTKAIAEPTG
jgi:hypothetical protein